MACDHDISPVYPHPHVLSRLEVCRTVVAEPPAVFTVDPDALAHGDLPCKLHIPVAPFRVNGKCPVCLAKERIDTLPCQLFCCGVLGSLFHGSLFCPVAGCAVQSAFLLIIFRVKNPLPGPAPFRINTLMREQQANQFTGNMALSSWKLGFSVILAISLTLSFYFLIPATCPGFPTPVVSRVQLSDVVPDRGTDLGFIVDITVFNKGTRGNVVIVTKLVNASRNSVEGKTTKTLYMNADEVQYIQTRVRGPSREPYNIVVEAERKNVFNTEP
jgi:hypothetical protein